MLVSIQAGSRPLVDVYIPGPQGPKGDRGTIWLSGAGVPSSGAGVVQDWYLNTLNGDVYEKTGLTTWTLRDNITGPAATNDAQTWVKAHRWEPDSNVVPITIKANVAQTADLQQWQTNAGTVVSRILSGGVFSSNAFIDLSAATGTLTTTGTGLGDKIALYGNSYGFGIQSTRLVAFVTNDTDAFSVRKAAVSGNKSSGTDAHTFTAIGDATHTRDLSVGRNLSVSGEVTSNLTLKKNTPVLNVQQDPGIAGNSLIYLSAAGTANTATVQLQSVTISSATNNANYMTLSATSGYLFSGGTVTMSGGLSVAGTPTGAGFDTLVTSLRANDSLTGGGTVTISGNTEIRWTQRFIVISNGRGSYFGTAGYFDITMPADGTVITGVGGSANQTVTAGGIPLVSWTALFYILPIGSTSASVPANFRIVNYTADVTIPSNWVLVAKNNSDNTTCFINTQGGIVLRAGQSYNTSIRTAQDDLLVHLAGAETISGAKTLGSGLAITGIGAPGGNAGDNLLISSASPQIQFLDSDFTAGAAGRRWWIHVNSGVFYILRDNDDNNAWDSPHPFYISPTGLVNMDRSAKIISLSSSTIGLITRGMASQTANLQEWQDSAGTRLADIGPTGRATLAGITSTPATTSNSGLAVFGNASQNGALVYIRPGTGQTANNFEIQSEAGTTVAAFMNTGSFRTSSGIHAGDSGLDGIPTSAVIISSDAGGANLGPTFIPFIAKGAASQTASLQEWHDSAGAVLSKVDSTGKFYFNTELYGNGKKIFSTGDAYLRINQSSEFASGIWLGSSPVRAGVGGIYLGSTGSDGNIALLPGNTDAVRRITLAGNTGNISITGALTAGAYSSFTGLTTVPTGPGGSALVARGVVSQTAEVLLVEDSGGFDLFSVGATGILFSENYTTLGGNAGDFVLNRVHKHRAQTNQFYNNIWMVRRAAGTDWATSNIHDGISIDSSFQTPTESKTYWERNPNQDVQIWGTNGTAYMVLSGSGTRLRVDSGAAGNIGFAVRGFASQVGDLQQWQNSAGTVLARVAAGGQIYEGSNRVYSAGNPPPATDLSNYVTLNGAQTVTGAKTFTATEGVVTSRGFNSTFSQADGALSAANYPIGISQQTSSLTNWPDAYSVVLNIIQAPHRIAQLLFPKTSGAFMFRSSNGLTDGNDWDAWKTVATLQGTQTFANTITFAQAPAVPDASFAVAKLSATGTKDATTFLRGDNTWAAINISNMMTTDTVQTVTGQKTFSTSAVGTINLIVKGIASQTANLQAWQNSSSSTVGSMSASGNFYASGTITADGKVVSPTLELGLGGSFGSQLSAKSFTAGVVTAILRGATSQTADLQQWQGGTGTTLSRVKSDGTGFFVAGQFGPVDAINASSPNPALFASAPAANRTALIARAAASQTSDIQQWQDSAGNVLARVSNDGTIYKGGQAVGGNAADTEIMAIMGAF